VASVWQRWTRKEITDAAEEGQEGQEVVKIGIATVEDAAVVQDMQTNHSVLWVEH